ncbi:MAG: DUF4249 family protein [Bacteroidaceae bacterium]|nr:DUF4249 family protein [Bacteroidaceae bacterium]
MIKQFSKYLFILWSAILFACQGDELIEASPQLVVEGWIDAGGFPTVIVTTTVPINKEYKDVSTLEECLVKWAKVTVSKGDTTVVLTGKIDENHFPSYIYTTGKLRGEVGERYKLTVEYGDFFVEAETTIPSPVSVDSFIIKPMNDEEFCQMSACFTDDSLSSNYYAFFCMESTQDTPSSFRLSPQGIFSDNIEGHVLRVPIYMPTSLFKTEEEYSRYFSVGDSVIVKLVNMDVVSYKFWDSFEKIRMLSRNPLFPVSDNMESNIRGGLGYWCGYGASYYSIKF